MQIIEVRNDILKLAYSPFQNGLLLSDFLLVTEGSKSILAQVIGVESSKEKDINIAVLKGCLSVDETGKINSYVGFSPSTGAEISLVTQEQVISMLCEQTSQAINWGYLAQHDNILFKTEKNILTNKPLILMDDYANYNVIANNLVHSNTKLGEKTVLVDFDGSLKIDNAYYITLGDDFKLPLSYQTLNYIYETELKDEALSTQAIIQDIIIELQEYIKTLPEFFLPFSTIKSVIYSQYEENKIPELMLFKNKFVKYSQQGIFAENTEDFEYLNQAIKENNIIVIDATNVEFIWHHLLLNYLAKNINEKCSLIAKLENDNSDKKTILDIYNNHEINPILVSNYTHQYVNVLKSIAKNMILFPPISLVNDFAIYNSFIQKLNRDEYVICGEDTLYLSFLVRLTYINSNMSPEYIEEQIQRDVDKLYRAGANKNTSNTYEEETPQVKENYTKTPTYYELDNSTTEEDLDFLDELDANDAQNQTNQDFETQQYEQQTFDDEFSDADLDMLDNLEDGPNYPEINEEKENSEILTTEELLDEQIIEPISEQNEIVEQEDTSYENETEQEDYGNASNETETINEYEQTQYSYIEEENFEADNEVFETYEDNLDAQDDISSEQLEDEFEEENSGYDDIDEKENDEDDYQSQPIPIYSVPELDIETDLEFSEGNMVYHEKYGRGVIEKIMNYGNKTLCSIQFEEVGRRLLDPNLAGLKQV